MSPAKLITALYLVLFSYSAMGQLIADFEADVVEGCPPFIVTFSDSSSGVITGRNWTFGNGNQSIGNNQVVSATYTSPGYYTVKLVVSDGYDSAVVEKTQLIHVFEPPNAQFSQSSPLSGCAPLNVAFTDNSLPGDAPISGWLWDFGDASPLANQQNPIHNYNLPGNFTVTLQVTDTNGCTGTKEKYQLVQTDPKPNALFQASGPVSACSPPLTVGFNNGTTGIPPITYQWDYSIGTSTNSSPTVNFTSPGGYDVTLIVVDGNNCRDTLFEPNYIFIGNVVADFNVPDTVCLGADVLFEDNSFGGNTFSWDFGNGNVSSQQNPTTSFNTPGWHTVTLSISAGAGCDDDITKQIYVEEVIADFIADPDYGCEVPHWVDYTDQSVGNIVSWDYRFGEEFGTPPYTFNNTSTLQNPSNMFTTAGVFTDTLIVTSAVGCKDTLIKVDDVEVFLMDVKIGMDHRQGCQPLTVNFTNLSTPQDSIASVMWQFGDPNNTTSTLSAPQFTYVDTGSYPVTLSVITLSGCTLSFVDTVLVGLKQVADFNILSNLACASDSVGFINLSTDTSLINSYYWDFGDGASSSEFEPLHSFIDTGWMDISLVVAHNGCKDTLTLQQAIFVNGPVVDFYYDVLDCSNPYELTFFSDIKDATSFVWDFGDGSPLDSANANPQHTYGATGMYNVQLSAFNAFTNCFDTVNYNVYVRDVQAHVFSPDSLFCAPDDIALNATNSVDAVFYIWNFGGGSPNGAPINSYEEVTYDTSGNYLVTLVAQDQYGCQDTAITVVRGFMNHADFSANPTFGCVPLGVQFTDQTQSDTTLVNWAYSFGDGTMGYTQHPLHSYSNSGSHQYSVTLTVFDELGCTSFITYDPLIETSQPDVNFTASEVFLCEGESTDFTSLHNMAGYTYFWDFGDGGTSTSVNPSYVYSSPGTYSVSLTITNTHGCDSNFTRINYIDVQDFPQPMLMATPQDTSCYPAPVMIIDTGLTTNGYFWHWNFGDDSTLVTTGGNVAQHIYNLPGVYDVKVIVETTYGCKDSILLSNFIHIGGPIADLNVNPDTACFGVDVLFKADSASGIHTYTWDFGDGIVTNTQFPEDSVFHSYAQSGWITCYLFANDSLNECPKTFSDSVFVHHVTAAIDVDTHQLCVPAQFTFTGVGTGENAHHWEFGDGGHSNSLSGVTYTYLGDGTFNASFIAIDTITLCRDTADTTLLVHPLPEVDIIDDQVLCRGDSIWLWAEGGIDYYWWPGYNINTVVDPKVRVWPDQTTQYFVEVVDANFCIATDSVEIEVQQIPALDSFPSDTTLFIGQQFLPGLSDSVVLNYSWWPGTFLDCDNCPNPVITPGESITYTLTYSDVYGCFTADTSFTIEVDFSHGIYTPNTFTPNGDGLNDEFRIVAYGFKELKEFYIYNRWGEKVYDGNSFHEGWNGYYNGVLQGPNQIFVYRAVLERFNGEEYEIMGKLLLLSK